MNLHRANGADYDGKPFNELNGHQKIAKLSRGVLTLANVVSVASAGLSMYGAREIVNGRVKWGTFCLGLGRYGDRKDGDISHRLGTKSPTGEFVDASLDKLVTGVTAAYFFKHNTVRKSVLGFFVAQNLANVALTAVAKKRGNEIHPSLPGKVFTGGMWVELLPEVAAKELSEHGYHEQAEIAYQTANVLTTIVGATGIVATAGYAKDAFA